MEKLLIGLGITALVTMIVLSIAMMLAPNVEDEDTEDENEEILNYEKFSKELIQKK